MKAATVAVSLLAIVLSAFALWGGFVAIGLVTIAIAVLLALVAFAAIR